ncbi:hypothetical protein DNH61_21350 [Paenibacillus sambharensis]|uniref:AzlD domain-containing protein n=1 Tax=Paenibacillus sambharensis TaxID=1803190 RepID=A0A2W1LFD9_9BACL|nr:AzlD domain-containing protein [Paenibacillus sambharensis]PZD93752.1 hypothetical protein DNH61_21350 [Paenibacillus sambharensis]
MTVMLILLMGLITFIIRFTPLLTIKQNDNAAERGDNRFLEHLPLAVLCSLTVPGVFLVDQETPWVGIAAGITAVLLVLTRKVPLFGVIIGSVLAAVVVKVLYIG